MNSLKFPNDKQMLRKANDYLINVGVTNGWINCKWNNNIFAG
jgi:hypothetical protein